MAKKIIAMLLALTFVFAFAACGGKDDGTTTTPEETTADPFAEVDDTTAAPVDDTTAEVAVSDPTAAPADDTTAASSDSTAASAEETTAPAAKKPESKEEIVAYFNSAVNSVKTDAKVVKRQYSKITLNGSPTLPGAVDGILKLLGGADKFIGDQLAKNSKGEETFTGDQIKAVYPVEGESYASKLTAADVKEAKITEKDGKYIIRIVTVADEKSDNIKHGQGHAPKAFNVVLPGVVNENIPGVATSLVGLSSMNYPSSTCTITVDPATGRVINADYDLKWTINFDKVGVIIPFTTHDYYTITY
ncbi:MAG: hypothetical protein ACI4JG_03910 [Acutalibacteraceae bacterium]